VTGWSIRVGRTVGAPAASVWPHLATPARYSVWACPGVDHYDVRFEPCEGGPYVEEYRHGDREYQVTGTVAAFEPGRRVAFHRLTAGSVFGPADLIDITLTADGAETAVAIDHSFDELPDDEQRRAHEFYAPGWTEALRVLAERVGDG
jgi:uncharacterized protein YndB with AHSA1/START domain